MVHCKEKHNQHNRDSQVSLMHLRKIQMTKTLAAMLDMLDDKQ